MSEEIKNEEVLSESELENVAGGTYAEFHDDVTLLYKKGIIPYKTYHSGEVYNDIIPKLGNELGMDLKVTYHSSKGNDYQLNGEKISRDEFWDIFNEAWKENK